MPAILNSDIYFQAMLLIAYLCLATFMLSAAMSVRVILSGISRRAWAAAAIIAVSGFILRLYVSPFTDSINSVSWTSMSGAMGLSEHLLPPLMTDRGLLYPIVLSLFYRLSGPGETVVYWLNIAIGTANIVMLFILITRITKNEKSALLGSALYAFMPSIIWHSVLPIENAVFAFFVLSAGVMIFSERHTAWTVIASVSALGLVHITRSEALLLTGAGALYLIRRAKLKAIPALVLIAAFAIMSLPALSYVHQTYGTIDEQAGFEDGNRIFSLPKIARLAGILVTLYGTSLWSLGILLIPLTIGIYTLLRTKKRRTVALLAAWWLLANLPYVCARFDERYMDYGILPYVILVAVLASKGIAFISSFVRKRWRTAAYFSILALTILPIPVAALQLKHWTVHRSEIIDEMRIYMPQTDKEGYYVVPHYGVRTFFMLNGRNVIPYEELDLSQIDRQLQSGRAVYFLCYVDMCDEDMNFSFDAYDFDNGRLITEYYILEQVYNTTNVVIYSLNSSADGSPRNRTG